MSTLELIQLIIISLTALVAVIWFIVKAIKNKWFSKIYKAIKEGVVEAEKTDLKGKEKLNFALKYVEDFCDKEGIPFSFVKNLVVKAIEKLVEGYNNIKKGK